MKRKLFSLFLILSLLIALPFSVQATDPGSPWVVDNADLLTPEEEAELTRSIQNLRSQLGLEIVIVTTDSTGGKSVQEYADDFYDMNGYGYGEDNSGILLLLNMGTREWYMSTCGEAIYIFTDYALENLGDRIVPDLSNVRYYDAFDSWVNELFWYVESYRSPDKTDDIIWQGDDDYEIHYTDADRYYLPIALLVGFVAALVTVLIMRSSMNTAKLQSQAQEYITPGSFRLTRQSDVYLYSRVTKSAKPKNNSSGGSSVHRSSGGVSHGGRGGRF